MSERRMHLKTPETKLTAARPTILIVEDNFLIALSLEADLTAAGFLVAGPVASVAEAFTILLQTKVDAVLLDVDLGRERSFPVAAYLTLNKIPFAFLTSYSSIEIRRSFPFATIFAKPADMDEVIGALQALTSQAGVTPQPRPFSSPL